MASDQSNGQHGTTLHTERLKLYLADPSNDSDCEAIVRLYNNENAVKGGGDRLGVKTIADVREKHRTNGPKSEYCTLAPPPHGIFFLVYLPSNEPGGQDTLIGHVALSFRPGSPYPDLAYLLFGPYESRGYATEAARRVIQFWREEIGVKEIWVGTFPNNERSQRLAERVGFVRAGNFDLVLGRPPNEERVSGGVAYVLPGMVWTEGLTIYPTLP